MNCKFWFKEGLKITCVINGKYIKDAKLHWNRNYWGEKFWFICQNEIESDGYYCANKLEYKYAFQYVDDNESILKIRIKIQ